jgi:hypothetical protein
MRARLKRYASHATGVSGSDEDDAIGWDDVRMNARKGSWRGIEGGDDGG